MKALKLEDPESLKKMYQLRLSSDHKYRIALWKLLCDDFFQKFVPVDSIIMEIAAGHCEFINAIRARKKLAIDLNPDVSMYAGSNVTVIQTCSSDLSMIEDNSIDRVFVSNFFEHISREEITKTLSEIYRTLRSDGQVLILQPNFRFCMKDYYMFFDHITPIDDRALCEVLALKGFKINLCMDRFLPYTTKSKLPKSLFLVKTYLKMPLLFKIFGQQAFIIAQK